MVDIAAFTHLPQLGLLEITGPDSERFLQGQLTCDVIALNDQRWILGACCTAKGRMVANFVIARIGQTFWLRLPTEQVEALRLHLSKYAVFFKTTLTNQTQNWAVLGSIPTTCTPAMINNPQPLIPTHHGVAFTWPDGRSEYWLAQEQSAPAQSAQQTVTDAWAMADIVQGLIWVTQKTQEEWVPQHIDWQQQGGINFRKGCYTGQEIVARLQYLGKSKKQVVRIKSSVPLTLEILAPITNDAGKTIGEIAAWVNTEGLAVLSSEDLPNTVLVENTILSVSNLFYADHISE